MKPIALVYIWCPQVGCTHVVSARCGDVAEHAIVEHVLYMHHKEVTRMDTNASAIDSRTASAAGGAR